jgi:drug/metabolite transporter (DMT)-like permease
MAPDRRTSTLGGLAAVLIWSTSIAFSRSLTESLGIFSAGAFSFLLAGTLGVLRLYVTHGGASFAVPPRRYLLGCGTLFILYQLCLYVAVGLASGGAQVVEVGIINYLWPVLTLLLSLPLLKMRARWSVVPGFLLALVGTALAVWASPHAAPTAPEAPTRAPYLVPALAGVAALAWAFYSNFARKFASDHRGDAVPFFFLLSGTLMLALRFAFGEHSEWTTRSVLNLAYLALLPCLLAYSLWDRAMRRGDLILVAVFSYFTPLISTVVTCVVLAVRPAWPVWAACALLIAGAQMSRASLQAPAES